MQPLALTIIQDEHRALATMLRAIPALLSRHRERDELPDFGVLRAMLFYVDEFPERLHHPKESELLFPKLRARVPTVRETLNQLDEDHRRGERAIRELEHSLLAFEVMGQARRANFERMATHFVEGYLRHMDIEERQILPLALQMLSADDWVDLGEAFAANRDPLAGHGPGEVYAEVLQTVQGALAPR